ncbi:hypothetical protein ACWPKO_18870 (plasmid) [Coraliomargarita sp. W4R53]
MVNFSTTVPTPTPTIDPDTVTPGPEGFLVIALLTLAVILLVADMMRRIRRGRVRADINEELDAEQSRLAADTTGDSGLPADADRAGDDQGAAGEGEPRA